jgi:hypothetical protein
MSDQWGVGDQADAKAFDTVPEGELIFGQYPHSRQDNNIYLRRPSGDIVPFDGHRRLIDIDIKSSNYEKESEWSGDEIRKSVTGTVTVDGVQLVEEFGRDPINMMRRLERVIETYSEHESRWFDKKAREAMVGRKIYYHDQPATIKRLIESQGAIIIECGAGFKPPTRDEEDEGDWEDWKVDGHYEVKDDVLSPHIWWWRS